MQPLLSSEAAIAHAGASGFCCNKCGHYHKRGRQSNAEWPAAEAAPFATVAAVAKSRLQQKHQHYFCWSYVNFA